MSIEKVIRDATFKLRKTAVSIAEKVSDLVPKIGPPIGPRRDLIRFVKAAQKDVNKQFTKVLRQLAGRDAKLKRLIK